MYSIRKFLKDMAKARRRASASMPMLILTFAVISIIGVYIFAQIYGSLPVMTGAANDTVTAFQTAYYGAVALLGVSLIVLAAVSIIKIVNMLGQA